MVYPVFDFSVEEIHTIFEYHNLELSPLLFYCDTPGVRILYVRHFSFLKFLSFYPLHLAYKCILINACLSPPQTVNVKGLFSIFSCSHVVLYWSWFVYKHISYLLGRNIKIGIDIFISFCTLDDQLEYI